MWVENPNDPTAPTWVDDPPPRQVTPWPGTGGAGTAPPDAPKPPTGSPVGADSSNVPGTTQGGQTGTGDPFRRNDLSGLFRLWKQAHPASNPDIPGFVKYLNQSGLSGVTQATHAGGLLSDDKIVWNGKTYDLGSSLGGPSGYYFDNPMEGGGGGDEGGGLGAGGIDPSYLSPFTKPFSAPGSGLPPVPNAPAFSYPDFKPPSMQEILAGDPGYQFRLDQGRKSIEASASSKGLLNSGGTLADILGFGQSMASQEANNAFDRAFNVYGVNRNNAADTYKTNYNSQFTDPFYMGSQNANTMYNRAQQEFGNDKSIFYANQSNPFDKLFSLSQLGENAAAQ